MNLWNGESRWVTDEEGLRWYFSERDDGSPSRLECYRRLLAEPAGTRGVHGALLSLPAIAAAVRRMADLLELARLAVSHVRA
jgi:hypothetical protein